MRVPILRLVLCWLMVVIVPLSAVAQTNPQGPGAILHTQGGVWVNGAEAVDSAAVFAGDLVETKTGFSASLILDGSSIVIGPESVTKFQGDYLELDHGSVSVGTSKSFRVVVHCLHVIPVLYEWTQYEVSDVSGTVHVAARKDDVNVEHEARRKKNGSEIDNSQHASVKEGQQNNYEESQICGAAAAPTGAGALGDPKWLAIEGGAGAAILCLLLCRSGGSKVPLSNSTP